MNKFETLKQKMLADPHVRKAYDELTLEYAIARELIKTRSRSHGKEMGSRGGISVDL